MAGNGLPFATQLGRPLDASPVRRDFKKLCEEPGSARIGRRGNCATRSSRSRASTASRSRTSPVSWATATPQRLRGWSAAKSCVLANALRYEHGCSRSCNSSTSEGVQKRSDPQVRTVPDSRELPRRGLIIRRSWVRAHPRHTRATRLARHSISMALTWVYVSRGGSLINCGRSCSCRGSPELRGR